MNPIAQNLYNKIGDAVREFWKNNYYDDVIVFVEISYDNIHWDNVNVYVEFDGVSDDVRFSWDFDEGQKYYKVVDIAYIGDVKPVKHGRWKVLASRNDAICTNCEHYWIPNGDQYDYHYCPYCGAKMDEVEE